MAYVLFGPPCTFLLPMPTDNKPMRICI